MEAALIVLALLIGIVYYTMIRITTLITNLGSPMQVGGSIGNTAFGVNNAGGASAVNIQDGGNSITVDGAVKSVMTSLQIMKGGEIFVPKTINAIKIYDLARALCKIYSHSHSKIKTVGLRQGEKIHEKIFTEDEIYKLKIYNNIYVIDHMNSHKLTKIKKLMNFFSSEQAKVLTVDEIISYLKKFNLLNIQN